MNTNDEGSGVDLLIGAEAIRRHLVELGMPENTNPYYLKRSGSWPIGGTAANGSGKLIASKRRIARHIEKLTCGSSNG